jgi:cell division protein FtsW (lipid II flippase)
VLVRLERLRTELPLILISIALLGVGYSAATINSLSATSIPTADLRAAVIPAAAFLTIALIWAGTRMSGDWLILPCCSMLSAIGAITMHRLQIDIGGPDTDLGNLSGRHTFYLILSLAVLGLVARWFPFWPYLRRYKYLTVATSLGLLLVTLVAGRQRYGARLWIGVGPFEIQTSEFIKIGLILFLAAYLHEKHELMHGTWRIWKLTLPPIPYLIPLAVLLVVALLMVVAMNDLGTALLLFSTALAMLYVALRKLSYVLVSLATFAAGSFFAYVTFARVGVRVQNWLNPWQDPFVSGYQQIQADYAMSNGGLLGTGIGRGEPWRIPAVHTDYVFAAIVEEWGVLGGMAVIALFGLLLYRGLRIAARADSLYDRYLCVGISASIAIQALVILGGVLRLLPLTGVTLPFVSAGGTSLVLNGILIGMMLNISHRQEAGGERRRG